MNWLARLKKNACVPEQEATETAKTVSVVFVASVSEPFPKINGEPAAPLTPAAGSDIAMVDAEIDTFMARLARFTDKGTGLQDAERLAMKLNTRDRDGDDRRLCLECSHLQGAGCWRCANWQTAGVALEMVDAQLPADLTCMLQRCPGFSTS